MNGERLLGTASVLAAASIWGSIGLFAKSLYADGVSAEAMAAIRSLLGWVVVVGFVAVSGRAGELRVGARDLAFLVPQGLFGVGAFYLFYFYTIRESEIGTASILLYSAPAFVVVLARVFLKEPIGAAKLAALPLILSGIVLVSGSYGAANLSVTPAALLAGLLSGFAYALYALLGRPLTGHLSTAAILSYAMFFGAAVLVVAALPTLETLSGLPARAYAILLLLVLVHTALAYALYTYGLGKLGAGPTAIVATVDPVVAGLLGAALLGEALTVAKVIGGVLVICGAVLAQVRLDRSPDKTESCENGKGKSR